MKKLCLLMAAGLLFTASANADVICVMKKFAAKKEVVLSGKIKVAKTTCPSGYFKLLSTDKFKGPKGDKGAKGATGAKGAKGAKGDKGADGNTPFLQNVLPVGATVTGYVKTMTPEEATAYIVENKKAPSYFPTATVSLPLPSTVAIDNKSIGSAKQCTGSVDNPTAPAGKVCLYSLFGSATVSPHDFGDDKEKCEANNLGWNIPNCPYCEGFCDEDASGNRPAWLGYSHQSFQVSSDGVFEGIWAYTVPKPKTK